MREIKAEKDVCLVYHEPCGYSKWHCVLVKCIVVLIKMQQHAKWRKTFVVTTSISKLYLFIECTV